MSRLPVLDALRCLFASLVMFGHAGPPPVTGVAPDWAWAVIHTAGPVTGFFLISGFCIHYPFASRGPEPVPALRFYRRRYIRIVIPVVAVLALYKLIDPQTGPGVLWHSALWSVFCEELYYAAYPALNRIRYRWGWSPLLVPSLVISVVLAITTWKFSGGYAGAIETPLILLPVWLLGCVMAEQFTRTPPASGEGRIARALLPSTYTTRQIWLLRSLAVATNFAQGMLFHYTSLLSAQTFLVTGLILAIWLRAELVWSLDHPPNRWLVSGGLWSYSLYLMHPVIRWGVLDAKWFDDAPSWAMGVAAMLAASYVFYLLIERPAHRLARRTRLFEPKEELALEPAAEHVDQTDVADPDPLRS